MEVFSERIKSLRAERGLSQKEIANSIGISESAYQRYEQPTREPTLGKIIKIADYYDVSTDFLLGLSDDPTRR